MGIQAGTVLTTVYRLPRLWLTSLLAEASSDLTGPPSPSSSRESNSNMEEGLGNELWDKEREGQATGAGKIENIEEWETNQLQTQCRPPIQGLRTRPRPWPREVRQHGHPSPCQGWWSRLSALRSPTGYRQGCRCVSNMIRRIAYQSLKLTLGQLLRQERGCRLCYRVEEGPCCLRPNSPCRRPQADGAQEVRWSRCPCQEAKGGSIAFLVHDLY